MKVNATSEYWRKLTKRATSERAQRQFGQREAHSRIKKQHYTAMAFLKMLESTVEAGV